MLPIEGPLHLKRSTGGVENEIHFLLHCDLYTQIRENTFSDIFRDHTDLPDVNDCVNSIEHETVVHKNKDVSCTKTLRCCIYHAKMLKWQ